MKKIKDITFNSEDYTTERTGIVETKNVEMTIQQRNFNIRFGEYLKKALKNPNIYKIMLKANELYAMSYGHYPETDSVWIGALCYELLTAVEDIAWAQFPSDVEEAQQLLFTMSISELSAIKVA